MLVLGAGWTHAGILHMRPRQDITLAGISRTMYRLSVGGFVEHSPIIPYQEVMAVSFTFKLPGLYFEQNGDSECQVDDTTCIWESQIYRISEFVRANTTRRNGTLSITAGPSRRKRALGLWSLAASALPLIVDNFPKLLNIFRSPSREVTQEAAVMRYQSPIPRAGASEIPERLARIHQKYLDFKKKWDDSKGQTPEKQQKEVQAKIEGLQMISNGLLELVTLDRAMSKCDDGYLPSGLVRTNKLREAMSQVMVHLAKFGAEAVVPSNLWHLMYKMKTASCRVAGGNFVVNFQIPIKRIGEIQNTYRITPIPFKVGDVQCYMLDRAVTVIMMGQRPYFMPVDYCSNDEAFCRVSRDKNAESIPACLTEFFPDDEVLTEECHPVCMRTTQPVITEGSDATISIITDNKFRIQIVCDFGQTEISEVTEGALTLKLPCDCSIKNGVKTLVERNLLCDNKSSVIETHYSVPAQWRSHQVPNFLTLITNPPMVSAEELYIKYENDVSVNGEEFSIPKWAEEFLLALGAVVIMTIAKLLMIVWKRCCKCKRETVVYAGANTVTNRRASSHLELNVTRR